MKVLALDFSPTSKEFSHIHLLLTHLIKGMESVGATVEVIKFGKHENTLLPCTGCFQCWTVTPGECKKLNDDMSHSIFNKWTDSDLVIYATPIYNKFMVSGMKSFIERLQPAGSLNNFRGQSKLMYPDTVIMGTATYHGMDEFTFLSQYMNDYYAKEKNSKILAELYRSQIKFLGTGMFPKFNNTVLSAFESAGEELILKRAVSQETMKALTTDITEERLFNKLLLLINRSIVKNKMSHKAFIKNKPPLDIVSIDEFIILSRLILQNTDFSDAVLGKLKIQMDFCKSSCYIIIATDEIIVSEGIVDSNDVQIDTTFKTWMAVMAGKLTVTDALKQKIIKIEVRDEASRITLANVIATIASNTKEKEMSA